MLHLLQEVAVLVNFLNNVRHVKQDVCVLQSRLGKCQHRLLQLVIWLQHPWGIRKYDLRILRIDDTHDAMACRLRLKSGNGNTLTDKEIHER